MNVEIIRHPTDEDWERCKLLALTTTGKNRVKNLPDESWKYLILRARHSVIYTLWFTIRVTEEPYCTAMHFKTHHEGCVQFVSTQRNDRNGEYDRYKAPQDAPVTHTIDIDACALMNMANKRLCSCSEDRTRRYMQAICQAVLRTNPEFRPFLVPFCMEYGCHEFRPCNDATRYLP